MKWNTVVIASGILLAGCESEIKLETVCQQEAKLCAQLAPDPRCNASRRDVLLTHYQMGDSPQPIQQFQQLNNLEKYVNCAHLSTQIEYIDPEKRASMRGDSGVKDLKSEQNLEKYAKRLQESKRLRMNTYLKAKKMFDRLDHRTSFSDEPHLLYWHWTRHHSTAAINKLIELDKEGKLNEFDTAFYVGQEYVRYDQDKAKEAFFRSLRNYPSQEYVELEKGLSFGGKSDAERGPEPIHLQIFRGLVSIYLDEGRYANAYIFAKLSKINNDPVMDHTAALISLMKNNRVNLDKLEDVAWTIHEMMEDNAFNESILPEPI